MAVAPGEVLTVIENEYDRDDGRFKSNCDFVLESETVQTFSCSGKISKSPLRPRQHSVTVALTLPPQEYRAFIVGDDGYFIGYENRLSTLR